MSETSPSGLPFLEDGGLWIFGYGSLVWRPAFPFVERRTAHVRGWTRRFWQGSTDHRGVPGAPGRVVTLVPEAGARCYGVAYRVARDRVEEVLAGLDHREQGGYERHVCTLRAPGAALPGLLYRANAENPDYLGPAPLESIAVQVLRSRGPSGRNCEYVLELARFVEGLGIDEPHVLELARRLRDCLDEGARA